jgi:hypothetical protein
VTKYDVVESVIKGKGMAYVWRDMVERSIEFRLSYRGRVGASSLTEDELYRHYDETSIIRELQDAIDIATRQCVPDYSLVPFRIATRGTRRLRMGSR